MTFCPLLNPAGTVHLRLGTRTRRPAVPRDTALRPPTGLSVHMPSPLAWSGYLPTPDAIVVSATHRFFDAGPIWSFSHRVRPTVWPGTEDIAKVRGQRGCSLALQYIVVSWVNTLLRAITYPPDICDRIESRGNHPNHPLSIHTHRISTPHKSHLLLTPGLRPLHLIIQRWTRRFKWSNSPRKPYRDCLRLWTLVVYNDHAVSRSGRSGAVRGVVDGRAVEGGRDE